MGVREKIMALRHMEPQGFMDTSSRTVFAYGQHEAKLKCADIAEARERDLLERVEKAENMERIALARLEAREKELLTEKAELIAELRTIKRDGISGFIDYDDVQAILAKYEEK